MPDIYTQNMQGGSNVGFATGQIRRHSVVMLQECGRPSYMSSLNAVAGMPGVSMGEVNFGTSRRRDDRTVIHHASGRCSQSLILDTALGAATPFLVPAPSATLRPMLCASIGGDAYGSFHAPSGNHNAARGVLRSQTAALLAMPLNSFILAGDANSDIADQQIAGSVTAYSTQGATHQGGGNLDGMLSSVNRTGNVTNVGMSAGDHAGLSGRFA